MSTDAWNTLTLEDGQVVPSPAVLERTDLYLVDVRPFAERHGELGFIPATHHVDLAAIVDGSRTQELPADRPLVIVCRSGKRAQTALEALLAQGRPQAKVLQGGMLKWRELGLPAVTPAAGVAGTAADDAAEVARQVRDALTQRWSEFLPASNFSELRKLYDNVGGGYRTPDPAKQAEVFVAFAELCRVAGHPAAKIAASVERLYQPLPTAAPTVQALYHKDTFTMTYVIYDPESKDAIVIDPVLDFDQGSWQTTIPALRGVVDFLETHDLALRCVLETHAHADHLSGAAWLRQKFGVPVAIGEHIRRVQETFKPVFGLPESFPVDGSQFDRLLKDGEVLEAGTLRVRVLHTPGHTPACSTYVVGDAVFTGDALFLDDSGCGRCDFPKGSAEDLYDSIQTKVYTLPDEFRLFTGHDYQPGGREVRWETTIGRSKAANPQIKAATSKEDFVTARRKRDATLAPPKLLFPSIQVNIAAGKLPCSEPGRRLLHIPLNFFKPTDDAGEPI